MNRIAPMRVVTLVSLMTACSADVDVEEVKQVTSLGDPVLATTRVENRVTVHEHAADALARAPQWTLEPTPLTQIESDSQYDLAGISYAVPLSDGRVMTFAARRNKIFVFNRDGKGERVIGRTDPRGPADWMLIGDPVLLENDTVLVLDYTHSRLNWVTADNGIVRKVPYDVTGLNSLRIAGLISRAEMLLHSAGTWGRHREDSRHRSLAVMIAANITTPQLAAERPEEPGMMGNTRFLGMLPDRQGGQVETRYRGNIHKSWIPFQLGGSALLVGWDSVYATVEASSRSIELHNATGVVVARIDVPTKRRAVTQTMRAAHIAQELARLNAPGAEPPYDRDESARLARETPFADSLPYFAHLFTVRDQTLWVVDAIAPSDSGWTATALRQDGAILARLNATGKSIPMAFGANQVIVRAENENGVVSLRVYRFTDKR